MEPTTERRERTSISEAALEAAYATYDSDPRVHGPDDYDAFRAGIAAYISALPEPSEAAFVEALDRIARFAKVRFDVEKLERIAVALNAPAWMLIEAKLQDQAGDRYEVMVSEKGAKP